MPPPPPSPPEPPSSGQSSAQSSARGPARGPGGRARVVLIVLAALALVTGLTLAVGLNRSEDRSEAPDPGPGTTGPSATPPPELDLTSLAVVRAPFCDDVQASAVRAALGAPVSDTRHYDSGERVLLDTGLRDLSHEFGCTYLAADSTRARAWVFAEPVGRDEARGIVRDLAASTGCSRLAPVPGFGRPSLHSRCRTGGSGAGTRRTVVTLSGLFGDSWLSCRLSAPERATGTVRRAQRWCVAVAEAASGDASRTG